MLKIQFCITFASTKKIIYSEYMLNRYIWSIKGTGHRFIMEVHGTVTSSGIRFTLSVFHSFYPCGRTFEFMVSRVGLIAALLLMVDHFGPIRDTI